MRDRICGREGTEAEWAGEPRDVEAAFGLAPAEPQKQSITSKLKLYGDTITDYDMLEKMFTTFHASNMVVQQQYREKGFKNRSHGCGRRQRRNFPGVNNLPKINNHQKWKGKDEKPKANGSETECYGCGGKGHWPNICRIPRHLVELYQASLKNKGPEANFVYDNEFDITHLDVADFFKRPDGKIDHLIGDGSVVKED
uniref:CCHC-type domain-containing protein n=1 Tax=Nicotiana tabacum TaxID=4097 RepID=A0A1S3XXY6_TOBAC|nr:PREDICTED: uncharacterized protein LOC107770002 [Nicotiana tabacum]